MARGALFALTAPSVVLGVAWLLARHNPTAAILWLLGLLMGAVLQRSRYCIAAALRDSVLFGDTGPARSLLLALAIASVVFGAIQAIRWPAGELPPAIQPLTAGTLIGPLLFGIGMIPAGGCAASTLLRIGEGHLRFLWTAAGLVLGSMLGAYHYGWWESLLGQADPVYLPAAVGWPAALVIQALGLGGIYLAIRWRARREEGI